MSQGYGLQVCSGCLHVFTVGGYYAYFRGIIMSEAAAAQARPFVHTHAQTRYSVCKITVFKISHQ